MTFRDQLQLRVDRYFQTNGFALHARDDSWPAKELLKQERHRVVTGLTFTEVGAYDWPQPEPFCLLSRATGQELMDELWRAGLRPTWEGTEGQAAATQKHLQDMRVIVGKYLDLPDHFAGEPFKR